jgi:hypothetical protein
MRAVLVATLCALLATPALGQTNPPGYTPFDMTQQAKLRGDVGTWQCVSVPAANPPISFTETEQGNWFVTRRTGANPGTSYERWSHVLKAYILIAILDSGASDVAQTTSLDPDNATYTEMWPALDNQGRKRFDSQVTRMGNAIRSTSHFYDEKGDVRSAETSCTRQP